jgi:hypothetical protein
MTNRGEQNPTQWQGSPLARKSKVDFGTGVRTREWPTANAESRKAYHHDAVHPPGRASWRHGGMIRDEEV